MQLFDRYFFARVQALNLYTSITYVGNFLPYSDGIKTNIDFILCYELITLVYIIMRDNSNTPHR